MYAEYIKTDRKVSNRSILFPFPLLPVPGRQQIVLRDLFDRFEKRGIYGGRGAEMSSQWMVASAELQLMPLLRVVEENNVKFIVLQLLSPTFILGKGTVSESVTKRGKQVEMISCLC